MILAAGGLAAGKALIFMMLPLVGGALIALGIFQIAMDLRQRPQRRVLERLQGQAVKRRPEQDTLSILKQQRKDTGGALEQFVRNLSIVPRLQKVIDQADLPWSASRVLLNLVGVGLAGVGVAQLLRWGIVKGLCLGAALVVLPLLWIQFKKRRRLNRLVEQLPDVFQLMSQALRAGHSLASGIQLVSEQLSDPAATEFARIFHEQNLGIKVEEALQNFADRVDILDVRYFVTAVLIQRQTGGDLAEVLEKISSIIQDRLNLFGQVRALTAEGRLSAMVLLALPIGLFFVMLGLNREYAMTLINDPTGRYMLYTGAVMQIMGWAMMKKITNIKV